MNLFGSGHGGGIKVERIGERKPRAAQVRTTKKKYSDELVAHAKWMLQRKTLMEVALKLNLPPSYVGQIERGLIRANVEPKEMK